MVGLGKGGARTGLSSVPILASSRSCSVADFVWLSENDPPMHNKHGYVCRKS